MKVEQRKIADLTEYEKNSRLNDATVKALTGMIDKFGYLVPMVVTEEGVIVAGHARYKALKASKVEEATCVIIKGNENSDEFRVLDNKIHELSEWDKEKLNIELRGLDGTREEMFPELGVEEVSIAGPSTVTKGQVDWHQEQLEGKYEKNAEAAADSLCRVKCSGCQAEFQIKKSELER